MRLVRDDITLMDIDAFVFDIASDMKLDAGFGGAIQRRGGIVIQKELDAIGALGVGEAAITQAGILKAGHIIHLNGPKFREEDEEGKLRRATKSALRKADENGIKRLAFPPVGRLPIVDRVEREAISREGIARPVKEKDAASLEFVACGRPLPGHQIRIIDQSGRELPERREGRLQFKGPSATKGYFRDEEKTRALFDGEWLESGDLGYIAGGDVFITGRTKDVIIRAGRNIYPHELEELVGNIEGVR